MTVRGRVDKLRVVNPANEVKLRRTLKTRTLQITVHRGRERGRGVRGSGSESTWQERIKGNQRKDR